MKPLKAIDPPHQVYKTGIPLKFQNIVNQNNNCIALAHV